jgi:hypothetical protein
VLAIFGIRKENTRYNSLFYAAGPVVILAAAFIALCGATHLVHAISDISPNNRAAEHASAVLMVLCAVVSILSATVNFILFPKIADALSNVELDSHGKLQHAESYMVDIVNMVKESVVVLSPEARIVRGNDISKTLFGTGFIGQKLTSLVHREDRPLFESTLQRVLASYDGVPVSIEYRISTGEVSMTSNTSGIQSSLWVESTFCKGTNVGANGVLNYDVKMLTRSIDDRKRGARYRQYYEEAKEREAVNEAKLRYVSCIAHDLKTPLQSFCFTTELLKNTPLTADQEELLQQADVAVDLLKLTISQTMDITKALTGAKLMPRRTAVQLSSVIERVRIIM